MLRILCSDRARAIRLRLCCKASANASCAEWCRLGVKLLQLCSPRGASPKPATASRRVTELRQRNSFRALVSPNSRTSRRRNALCWPSGLRSCKPTNATVTLLDFRVSLHDIEAESGASTVGSHGELSPQSWKCGSRDNMIRSR